MNYSSPKFLALMAMPVLLACCGIVWVTLQLLDRVSTVANEADHARNSQVIQSAFAAEIKSLKDLTTDNARWDDAVRVVYGKLEEDWIETTWGVMTAEGNYDQVLVIDPTEPRALSAFIEGSKSDVDWRQDLGDGLLTLLAKLPEDLNQPGAEGAILNTSKGPAVVTVAFVSATTEGLLPPQTKPRALVLVRYLGQDFIARMSEQYVIKDLHILAPSAGGVTGNDEIKGSNGDTIALVSWSDLKPGEKARESAAGITRLGLTFLVFVVAAMGLACWSLIRTLSKREGQAMESARRDSLTGLPNRLAITEAIAAVDKDRKNYALAFLDLDGFKDVNDTFDHETGDQLLRAVAVGLQHLTPAETKLARLGGDEFVVLFRGESPLDSATQYARNIIEFINMPFDLNGRHARVGISVGISSSEGTQKSVSEMMRQADVAMYHAKANGKNCMQLFSDDMDRTRIADLEIAKQLQSYLEDNKIKLEFQPIVDASSHRISAVEALARWPGDAPYPVSPDRFVAVAERRGLIDALGEAVLHMACEQVAHWDNIDLNVNVSVLQFNNPAFVETTLAIIRASTIAPHRITLELTESALIVDMERTCKHLDALRAHGIRIALDDFGAGYASLGYLQKLKFDCIKIDKIISDQFDGGTRGLNIVQATALLAKGVASTVVAEGIESAEQGEILRLSGCSHLQGFHFHKPMSAAKITDLLEVQDETRKCAINVLDPLHNPCELPELATAV